LDFPSKFPQILKYILISRENQKKIKTKQKSQKSKAQGKIF